MARRRCRRCPRFYLGPGVVLLLSGLGCGPFQYFGQVSGNATLALARAERESAAKLAPYEYTKARAYLRKSREEASESSFETAIDYGRRAEALALRAQVVSRERAQRPGAPVTEPPPTEPTPAAGPPAVEEP